MTYKKFKSLKDNLSFKVYTKPQTSLRGADELRAGILEVLRINPRIKVADLLNQISKSRRVKKTEVVRNLIALEESGMVEITESQSCESLFEYMISADSTWFLESLTIVVIALLLIFMPSNSLFFFGSFELYLRYFFGGILVLFLPGYSLIQSVWANRSKFDDLTRLVFSSVMSLAIAILLGIVLGISPIGLEIAPVAVSLAIFTLIFLLFGLIRKYEYYRIASRYEIP